MAGSTACATAPPLWRPRYPGLGHTDGGTERCESWCSDQECEQLVTIATHEVSAADHLVLQRLALELRRPAAPHVPARTQYTIHDAAPSAPLVESRPVKAQLRVMIYDEGNPSTDLIYNDSLSTTISPGGWCVWGNKALEAFFPRLADALSRHYGYLGEWPSYFRLYYFLSSALAIWDRTFAKAYPRLRYWWRMEPDVLFSGSLRTLLGVLDIATQADCLLPGPFLSQRQMPSYSHWERNADISIGWPPSQILWSLVVVARYSRRMMDLLESSWDAGLFGFEEISMPALCLTSPNCTLAKIGSAGIIEEEDFSYSTASHVQFRPFWSCEEYLSSRMHNTHELWHPVKDRNCLVRFFAHQTPPTAPSPEFNRPTGKGNLP
ncbi:hypothetical protein AB1Y20_015771 [Prymnesium parvum]|uniref:Protein xylosyltransferase n=1 Tax=Prymnesium parvum TaxID=97485 RepID=A0AB34JY23_PRYPA